ncbi:MAG: hypothetical protein QOD72_497 [Acidimicrobiaceae bacterium]|nr:hypothetical protein [Acidimicrobiaceae bacterium]
MPAQIMNDPNSTPSVTPDEVDALNPQEVAFHCTMANLGDESGDTTGWYWTVDGPDGSIRHSDYINDNTLEPGATFETGANLERDFVTSLEPGTFWVSLRNPNGDTTASATLVIKQ